MHFIYGYFIIQLKCFNAFNCFFISQLDPGAQKDQIPERWPGLHCNSHCKRSSIAFSCIVTVSPIPSIALSVHCLSWSVIFSLSFSLQPWCKIILHWTGGVQCTLHYVEMHCRSFCLSFTLWRTERQNRGARPSGGPVSLPFTFN